MLNGITSPCNDCKQDMVWLHAWRRLLCTAVRDSRQGCWMVQELKPEQVVALVSCTVWQERAEAGQKVRQDMQGPFAALTEAARTVAKVQCCSANTAVIQTFLSAVIKRCHCPDIYVIQSRAHLQILALSRYCHFANAVIVQTLLQTLSLCRHCHCAHVNVTQTLALSKDCHCLKTLPTCKRCPCANIGAIQTWPSSKHCHCLNNDVVSKHTGTMQTLPWFIRCSDAGMI